MRLCLCRCIMPHSKITSRSACTGGVSSRSSLVSEGEFRSLDSRGRESSARVSRVSIAVAIHTPHTSPREFDSPFCFFVFFLFETESGSVVMVLQCGTFARFYVLFHHCFPPVAHTLVALLCSKQSDSRARPRVDHHRAADGTIPRILSR